MPGLDYLHVDVFSARAYGGNSLPVFHDAPDLSAAQMLTITQELRQFETIFLQRTPTPGLVRARIFDLFEELPFAGHPLIGAAAALQQLSGTMHRRIWTFDLSGRQVMVEVETTHHGYAAWLDLGAPHFLGLADDRAAVARAFSLAATDLDTALPLEVASTGLRYLVIPLRPGRIQAARVAHDLTDLLAGIGAQFAVLLDPGAREIRHWNNDGIVEDIATGSAAGVVAAYCIRHGLAPCDETFELAQGRFVARPSTLNVRVDAADGTDVSVKVGGMVAIVGRGTLDHAPEIAA
jgi:trans-2,3-dihydro-3-hydroxyanthranilate isomerase